MPHRRADAVGAGVAAADDDDVLVARGQVMAIGVGAVEQALGVGVQELHGEMDAVEVPPFGTREEVVGLGRAAAQDDGVEFLPQSGGRVVLAYLAAGDKRDALGLHQIDAALHEALVQLHVRDAVHEQTAGAVGALEDRDPVAGPVELIGAAPARPVRSRPRPPSCPCALPAAAG